MNRVDRNQILPIQDEYSKKKHTRKHFYDPDERWEDFCSNPTPRMLSKMSEEHPYLVLQHHNHYYAPVYIGELRNPKTDIGFSKEKESYIAATPGGILLYIHPDLYVSTAFRPDLRFFDHHTVEDFRKEAERRMRRYCMKKEQSMPSITFPKDDVSHVRMLWWPLMEMNSLLVKDARTTEENDWIIQQKNILQDRKEEFCTILKSGLKTEVYLQRFQTAIEEHDQEVLKEQCYALAEILAAYTLCEDIDEIEKILSVVEEECLFWPDSFQDCISFFRDQKIDSLPLVQKLWVMLENICVYTAMESHTERENAEKMKAMVDTVMKEAYLSDSLQRISQKIRKWCFDLIRPILGFSQDFGFANLGDDEPELCFSFEDKMNGFLSFIVIMEDGSVLTEVYPPHTQIQFSYQPDEGERGLLLYILSDQPLHIEEEMMVSGLETIFNEARILGAKVGLHFYYPEDYVLTDS